MADIKMMIRGQAVQVSVPDGSSDEFIKDAGIQAYNSKFPGPPAPPKVDMKPDSSTFAGRFSQLFPGPESSDKGFLPGLKRGISALNPFNMLSDYGKYKQDVQKYQNIPSPTEDQKIGMYREAAQGIPALPDIARLGYGDIAGEAGTLAPMAAIAGIASPKIRGAVSEGFNEAHARSQVAPPNRIASALGGIGGVIGGAAIGKGLGASSWSIDTATGMAGRDLGSMFHPIEAAKGFVAGAKIGARNTPLIPPVVDQFFRRSPGEPSAAMMPDIPSNVSGTGLSARPTQGPMPAPTNQPMNAMPLEQLPSPAPPIVTAPPGATVPRLPSPSLRLPSPNIITPPPELPPGDLSLESYQQ